MIRRLTMLSVIGAAVFALMPHDVNAQDVIIVRPPPRRQPNVVVVRPAPPPRRTVVITKPAPAPRARLLRTRSADERKVGLHAHIGGTFGPTLRIAGLTGALRVRPIDQVAIDLGIGIYGGTDYDGDQRVEVPISIDGLFYLNPRRGAGLQVYLLAGAGISFARKDDLSQIRDFRYLAGEAGVGVEWRLLPGLALNLDARAFLRTRIDQDTEIPEFIDGQRSTNTSAGGLLTLGTTIYF